jgi:poly(A) polymerase/tRNA nucleotidyltransferase (CCA-adding enzyme)
MRLAGVLHDVGKADTRKVIGDRVTFHKHEMVSFKLTRAFLNRLKYDSKTKEEVLTLVRLHMYHYTRDYTNAAVRRFIKRVGINKHNIKDLENIPLFKLRKAERLGNGLKTDPVTQRQRDFEKRIKKVFEAGGGLDLKDLDINGHILIEAFGLDPRKDGKLIGEILRYLLDRVQRDKSVNNRMSLIEMALQYLKTKTA